MNSKSLVAFDLDGTLLDTAKDFFEAVKQLRKNHHFKEPIDFLDIRNLVSEGAAKLAAFALKIPSSETKKIEKVRDELLEIYDKCCLNETRPFEEINLVLDSINEFNIPWGIVTNKPKFYAKRIVDTFLSQYEPKFLVCPDDTGERKPSPKGLLMACKLVEALPQNSIYVGDHLIDIQAGRLARMTTIAADYGYIPKEQRTKDWGADFTVKSPKEINLIISKVLL